MRIALNVMAKVEPNGRQEVINLAFNYALSGSKCENEQIIVDIWDRSQWSGPTLVCRLVSTRRNQLKVATVILL